MVSFLSLREGVMLDIRSIYEANSPCGDFVFLDPTQTSLRTSYEGVRDFARGLLSMF